jgi:2-polyprenyl-3-methyl-5-hydroxy-6-metoxy-1,4-benzoquinol methylase
MDTKTVTCNICDSDNYTELYPAGKAQVHRIVNCNVCNLIYANPQTDNVSAVEKNHLTSGDGETEIDVDEELRNFTPENHQYMRKQFLQLNDYAKIIDFVEKKDKGTFMEIGSYAGIFLNEAKKKGWDVVGIEPLEIPALYSEKLGVRVIREYFENAAIEEESLDVIVATHVIEHVSDPSAFVDKAYRLLKPGGKLILETPTYDSLSFKLLGHRERSVRCNGHIYFFTKDSLSKLVEKSGFKILKHEKVGRTLTIDRLFYNFGVITGRKQFFASLSNKLKLDKFVVRINTKDMQRIYCEKA